MEAVRLQVVGSEAVPAQGPGWEAVFGEHYPGLVRHLGYLLGDRAAAEDVAQEAFVRLMRRPPPRGGDLGGWLRVAATRLAYNYLRGERRRRSRERALAGDRALAGAGAGGAPDGAALVRAALERLPPRDRMAVLLRASGASYAELAAALGVAPGSVGTTLARATRRLRAAYGDVAGDVARDVAGDAARDVAGDVARDAAGDVAKEGDRGHGASR